MVTWIIGIASASMIIGGLFYIKEMFWGNTRPNRISWFLWGLPSLIASGIAWQDGVEWRVWLPILAIGLGTMLIVFLSFLRKDGYWQLGPFDYACGFFALLAITFWVIVRDPLISIILAMISDGLAALPTIIKSWKFPVSETPIAYLTTSIASATGLLALERGDFIEWAFPAYLALLNMLIAVTIYYRQCTTRV